MTTAFPRQECTTLDNVMQRPPAAGGRRDANGPPAGAELLARLKDAVREKDRIIAHLQKERDELRGEVTRMRGDLARYRDKEALLFNVRRSEYAPNDKVLIADVFYQLERTDEHAPEVIDGHVRYNQKTAAQRLKLSENTVGIVVETLVSTGALSKITRPRESAEGHWYQATFLKPIPEALRVVHTLPKEEVKAARKQRYGPCEACHSDQHLMLVKRTELHCACGHVQILKQKPRILHPGIDTEPAPEQGGDRKNCDVIKQEYPLYTQASDDLPGSDQTAGADRKFCDQQETPALVDQVTSWDDTRLLDEMICSLLEIAWEDTTLVEMTRIPGLKYVELVLCPQCKKRLRKNPTTGAYVCQKCRVAGEKEVLTTEALREHLKTGKRCLAYKKTDAPYTRQPIYDFDTPAGVKACEEALRKLDDAGLPAIIEYSPVHNAGLRKANGEPRDSAHLIVTFDAPVSVRGFKVLLARLCPELLEHIDKTGPDGSNMRMPGGYYDQPEVQGWCTLFSGWTGETAQAGTPAAWKILLSHQADHRLVPDLPPEHEPPDPKPTLRSAPAAPLKHAGSGTGWIDGLQPKTIAQWFKDRHSLESIHPLATATHAIAIWRGEQGASVFYNPSGIWWDYGNHGDYPQSGDALDLYVLVNERPSAADFKAVRSRVLKEMGRQMAWG